jgi:WD40 repeat protein/transcriptional regulator with XRE-family HTH domain
MPDSDGSDRGQERFTGLLLRCRGRTRLTQLHLAKRVGVSRRTLQGWETGLMYPSAERLQTLIGALLEAGGMRAGHERADAEEMWAAVQREAPRAHPPFEADWFNALLAEHTAAPPPPLTRYRHDWGDAPAVVDFVGRTAELATVRDWVLRDHCRLIGVLGMGGIGKTSIAAKLAQEVAPAFERAYWRGLRNAPPVTDWLAGAIGILSDQQVVPPEGEANQLAILLRLLRDQPNLLVLDNFETLLEPGQREGRYRDGFAGYGSVLQAIGQTSHQSCVVVTSREAPPDWSLLGGGAVRALELGGLGVPEGQLLLAHKQLSGDEEAWADLIAHYGGNGLALKVVGETIRQVFGGDIGAFLAESGADGVFGGIRRLLAEQIERSSPVERNVLRVLAVEREPVVITELLAELAPRDSRGALVESIEALRRRSLVERAETAGTPAFTLQSVVLEYVTERLVEHVCDEIERARPAQLVIQPLIKAQAKEYVRQSQERLIGYPIIQQLRSQHGARGVESLLRALLDDWRTQPPDEQGYGPGNAVNLLRLLRGELRGLDLTDLALRQAYLAGIDAQDVSLARADLAQAVLTEAFNFPLSVALSRDGAFLVAGTSAGEVCLWRVADRTPLLVVHGHSGPVHGVALSEDGRLLVSASEDGSVRLWEAPSGRLLATLTGHTSPVYGVALSGAARLLASGSFDGTIRLWDTAGGQLLGSLEGHTSGVWSVTLSADGRLLASGSFDGAIRLWDVASRRALATLDGDGSPVWSVGLSADGRLLASGTEDGRVHLWDVATVRLLATLQGHTGAVRGVALSADGQLLASASWDGTVRLWATTDGRPAAVLEGHSGPVRGVALNGDGRLIASGSLDGSVRLWEAPGGRALATLEGHTSPVYGVALSGGGLLASGNWDGTVRLWQVPGGELLATLAGHSSPVYGVALSADGQVLASGSWDRGVGLWQVHTGRLLATLHGHTGGVRSVALSADGQLLASGSWDGTIRLWQAPEGRCLATLRGHSGGVRSVALSADGRLLASGGLDGTVRLWAVPEGRLLTILEGQVNPVYGVALRADGRLLAAGSWDGTVRLWAAPAGELLATLRGHTGEVRSVALSSAGSLLASGGFDGTVRLWEVPDGRTVAVLEGHTSPVYGVAISQDGRLLASASFDGTVRLWDGRSGACLRTLRGDRPYERVDITSLTGVTAAQRAALLTLGAIDRHAPRPR